MTKDSLTRSESAQKEYYNRIADEYDKHYANPYALKYRWSICGQVFKEIDLSGKTVLDAMCGGGEASGYFLQHGAVVTGLDISENCCRIYKERFKDSDVVCSSILNTEFPDECFDIVVIDSLHHLHPYVEQGIKEIHRILKPSGYFCCWEPIANSFVDLMRRIWYKMDKKYFQDNEKAIDIDALERLNANRFEVIKKIYGGNLAYLFVFLSMAMRIPERIVKYYAQPLLCAEKALNRFQNKLFSCWVLFLMRKRNNTSESS